MAKITRAFQKIFADGITPTGNIAVFGSLAAGSPAYSKDPVAIQSLSQWSQGWGPSIIGNQSPALEDFNAYQYLISRQIAYLFQSGMSEWEANTVYYAGNFCAVAGVIYRSKTDANQGNAVSDTANWDVLLSTVATSGSYTDLANKPSTNGFAKAWCRWKRGTGIISSYNVDSVTVGIDSHQRPTVNLTSGAVVNGNYIVTANGVVSATNPLQIYALTPRTSAAFELKGDFASGEDTISDFDLVIYG